MSAAATSTAASACLRFATACSIAASFCRRSASSSGAESSASTWPFLTAAPMLTVQLFT